MKFILTEQDRKGLRKTCWEETKRFQLRGKDRDLMTDFLYYRALEEYGRRTARQQNHIENPQSPGPDRPILDTAVSGGELHDLSGGDRGAGTESQRPEITTRLEGDYEAVRGSTA